MVASSWWTSKSSWPVRPGLTMTTAARRTSAKASRHSTRFTAALQVELDDAEAGEPLGHRFVGQDVGRAVVHHAGHGEPVAQLVGAVARCLLPALVGPLGGELAGLALLHQAQELAVEVLVDGTGRVQLERRDVAHVR